MSTAETECEATRIIKQAIHQLEVDKGQGIFNYAAIMRILHAQGESSCAN